jgi:Trk K+ transport system NAD-binding subunit
VGKELALLNIKGGTVVAIERKDDIILPAGNTVIEAGDHVTIFARAKEVDKINTLFAPE